MNPAVLSAVISAVVGLATIVLGANPILTRLMKNKTITETAKTNAEGRLAAAQADVALSDGAIRRIENLEAALGRAEDKADRAETRADASDEKVDRCQREIEQLRSYIGELRADFRRETGKDPRALPTPLPWPQPRTS